jgi:uncharacterized membrane protein YuzA (DUF378 family)
MKRSIFVLWIIGVHVYFQQYFNYIEVEEVPKKPTTMPQVTDKFYQIMLSSIIKGIAYDNRLESIDCLEWHIGFSSFNLVLRIYCQVTSTSAIYQILSNYVVSNRPHHWRKSTAQLWWWKTLIDCIVKCKYYYNAFATRRRPMQTRLSVIQLQSRIIATNTKALFFYYKNRLFITSIIKGIAYDDRLESIDCLEWHIGFSSFNLVLPIYCQVTSTSAIYAIPNNLSIPNDHRKRSLW